MSIQFFLYLIVHTLMHFLFLPLKLLVQLITIPYRPKFLFLDDGTPITPVTLGNYLLDHSKIDLPTVDVEEVNKKLSEKMNHCMVEMNKGFDELRHHADSPKFFGLWYRATNNIKVADYYLNHLIYDKYFIRKPIDELDENDNVFSTAAVAGMNLFIDHYIERCYENGEQEKIDELKQRLRKIIYHTVFDKPFFRFKHPKRTDIDNRGCLFSWWFLGCNFLMGTSILVFYAEILNDKKLKFLYRWIKWISIPVIWLPDFQFFKGKYYLGSWFEEHTQMIHACLGYKYTRSMYFKYAATFHKNRYWFNPDIVGLYYDFVKQDHNDGKINDPAKQMDISLIRCFLTSYDPDRKATGDVLPIDYKQHGYGGQTNHLSPYIDLKQYKWRFKRLLKSNSWNKFISNLKNLLSPPHPVQYARFLLAPSQYTAQYYWEKNMVKRSTRPRRLDYIDYVHLYSILLKHDLFRFIGNNEKGKE